MFFGFVGDINVACSAILSISTHLQEALHPITQYSGLIEQLDDLKRSLGSLTKLQDDPKAQDDGSLLEIVEQIWTTLENSRESLEQYSNKIQQKDQVSYGKHNQLHQRYILHSTNLSSLCIRISMETAKLKVLMAPYTTHVPPPWDANHHKSWSMADSTSNNTDDENLPWSKKIVLSLGGSELEGLAMLLLLQKLMDHIEKIELRTDPNSTSSTDSPWTTSKSNRLDRRYLPCHYFDYIGGSSTCGLIAILLGRLRLPIKDALVFYLRLFKDVFCAPPGLFKRLLVPQSRKAKRRAVLHRILNEELLAPCHPSLSEDPNIFNSDPRRCRTIVCVLHSTEHKNVAQTPFLLRSYGKKSTKPSSQPSPQLQSADTPRTMQIEQVSQAACAASLHPSPIRFAGSQFYDASLVSRNPAEQILREVDRAHDRNRGSVDVLVSFGWEDVERKHERFSKRRRAASKSCPQASSSSHVLSGIEADDMPKDSDTTDSSFRLKRDPRNSSMLREWTSSTPQKLQRFVDEYIANDIAKEQLTRCAEMLVARRRDRAQTERWERFASGTRFYCFEPECSRARRRGVKPFLCQNAILDHLRLEHGHRPPNSRPFDELQAWLDRGRTSVAR